MDVSSIAVTKFLDVHRSLCPSYRGFSKGINNHSDIYTEMFGKNGFITTTFENNQILKYKEYIGYAESLSYSLEPKDPNYQKYIKALNEVFHKYSISEKN